ncbi:MAG: hypothetical protein CMP11_05205 [Zetaproteobacteria bacterium]|nr:hypothetical protein [Pseudobdellovibrionaceae bacterium]
MIHKFLFILLIIINLFGPKTSYGKIYQSHPLSRLYLGAGHDPFRPGNSFLECVEHKGLKSPVFKRGSTTHAEISLVKSKRDFFNKIKFSALIEGSYFFTEGKFAHSFHDEELFHHDSLSWIILFETDYGNYSLKDIKLKDDFRHLEREKLYTKCGREIVSEVKKGVSIYALLTVSNLSSSQKKNLETKFRISSHGKIWNTDLETSYQSFLSAALLTSDIKFKIYAHGGDGIKNLSKILTENESIKYEKIPKIMAEHIKTLNEEKSIARQYVTIDIDSFTEKTNPKINTFKHKQLLSIYFKYDYISSVIKRLQSILNERPRSISNHFKNYDKLQENLLLYEEGLNTLYRHAMYCFQPVASEKCILPSIYLPQILWEKEPFKNKRCEQLRQKALQLKLINEDFYKMSVRRNFIPNFSTRDKSISISRWTPCYDY